MSLQPNTASPVEQTSAGPLWYEQIGDAVSTGINLWAQVEKVNAQKDAAGAGYLEMNGTPQVDQAPQDYPNQTHAQAMAQKGSELMAQMPTVIGGGLLVLGALYWLTRR